MKHQRVNSNFPAPYSKWLAQGAGALISVSLANLAFAQQAAGISTAASSDTATLTEIVVTAQKKPERQVEAPVSVTVLDSQRLEQLGAKDLKDIAAFTPGMTFTSSGSTEQLILRGVSQGTSFSPLVAIIVDGAPIGSTTGLALGGNVLPHLNLADIERVEVLSGPQSTLYGSSSMGGLISYITKSGVNDPFGGEIHAEGSDTSHGQGSYLLRGAVNIPLVSDKAALRLSGLYQRDGAFLDNSITGQKAVNDSTAKGGRATLSLAPNDQLSVKLSASVEREDRGSSDTVVYRFDQHVPVVGPSDQGHLVLQPARRDSQIYTANINWRPGPVVVDSITGYSRLHSDVYTDFTASPFGSFITGVLGAHSVTTISTPRTDRFSQEFRVSSPNTTGWRWMAGVYYGKEDSTYRIPLNGNDVNNQPIPLLTPVYFLYTPSKLTSYAGFGNLTIPVINRLDLTLGVRETHDTQESYEVASGPLEPVIGGSTPLTRLSENHFDYLATLRYQVQPSTYAYVRVASGFRPGGSNITAAGIPPTFGPDTLVNSEVGLKSIFWESRAAVEVAAFHVDWSKIQLQDFQGGFAYFANSGKAKIDGIDFSGQIIPVPGLTLAANFALTDARLARAAPQVGGRDGEQLPNTAKFSGSFTAQYKKLVFNDWSAVLGANYSYIGKRSASYDNSLSAPQFIMDAYSMVDLNVSIENTQYRLGLFVRNVGNKQGLTSAYTGFGVADVGVTRPRQIGVQIGAKF